MEVVCAFYRITRRHFAPQPKADITADSGISGIKFVGSTAKVDEWARFSAAKIKLRITREVVEIEIRAGQAVPETVIAEHPQERKIVIHTIFQIGSEADAGIEYLVEGAVGKVDAGSEQQREFFRGFGPNIFHDVTVIEWYWKIVCCYRIVNYC